MPDWNRILGWDAFKVEVAGFDYYRDIFLVWPFLGFSIAATSILAAPQSTAYRIFGLKLAVCAVVTLLLAKERLILVLAASAYMAIKMAVGIIFIHTWQILLWLLVSGGILFIACRSAVLRDRKPNYVRPRKLHVLDIAIGMLGMAVMMAIARWMKP
jgi:hypothetical protein